MKFVPCAIMSAIKYEISVENEDLIAEEWGGEIEKSSKATSPSYFEDYFVFKFLQHIFILKRDQFHICRFILRSLRIQKKKKLCVSLWRGCHLAKRGFMIYNDTTLKPIIFLVKFNLFLFFSWVKLFKAKHWMCGQWSVSTCS